MGEHRGGLPAAAGGLQAAAGELRAVHSNLYDYVADRPPQLGGLDVKEQTYRAEFRHLEFETEHPVVEPVGGPFAPRAAPSARQQAAGEASQRAHGRALFPQRAAEAPSSEIGVRREGTAQSGPALASKPPAEPASERTAAALFPPVTGRRFFVL